VDTADKGCTALHRSAGEPGAERSTWFVSRLRKALGAVLATRPYRLADGVELRIEIDAADHWRDCAFVRHSAAPGVRDLAGRLGEPSRRH
jgi:hypothetical protein